MVFEKGQKLPEIRRKRERKLLFANAFKSVKERQLPIYKTHTKIEANRLRATNFAIAKLKEQ